MDKKFYIPGNKIKRIIESEEGCYAADRITVEGCKVGFMYREDPNDSNFADSGWRFMAGDEDDDYMNNPDNIAIYQVNTICNYDLDIVPFLDSAPGTAYIRDKNGKEDLRELYRIRQAAIEKDTEFIYHLLLEIINDTKSLLMAYGFNNNF